MTSKRTAQEKREQYCSPKLYEKILEFSESDVWGNKDV